MNRGIWTRQPQFAVPVHPSWAPLFGLQPGGHGLRDTSGKTLTVGTGITPGAADGVKSIDFTLSNTGLTRTVSVTDFPLACVFRGRVDDAVNIQMVSSLATTGDKTARLFFQAANCSAQHIGATTNAAAQATNIWSAGTVVTAVAVWASATDVRIYAAGTAGRKSAQTTTNVGALGTLDKLSFGRYDGSVANNPLDGTVQILEWLRMDFGDERAWSLVDNPWQLYSPLRRRIYVPSSGATDTAVAPNAGAVVIAGLTPTVTVTQSGASSPGPGAATVTGQAPTVVLSAHVTAAPAVRAVSLSGLAPTVLVPASFTTDVLINNTGTVLANEAVVWTWWPAGRIGAISGITPVDGTGTTEPDGTLIVLGLTAGPGLLLVAVPNTSATDDAVYYEAGTVA